MTDEFRDNLIMEIHSTLAIVASKVDEDHAAIRGNGRSGLLERVAKLEENDKHKGKLWYVLGFILNAALSIAALFHKR